MRKCVICGKEKEDEFFIHDKYAKDGIRNVCLECNKKRAKLRRARSKKHLEELENRMDLERQLYKYVLEENDKLKELLKECGRQLEEIELCRYDVADVDQEDWFRISTEQAGIAKKMKTKINEVFNVAKD